MRDKILKITAAMLFLASVLTLNYPVISTLYNQIQQGKLIGRQEAEVVDLNEQERKTVWEAAKAYNWQTVQNRTRLYDAFSGEIEQMESEYESLLNVDGSGMMGSIEIPKIAVYLPIYHGTSRDTLAKGVGHLEGSSLPVGGKGTLVVLTGHRGLPQSELFTNLDQMEKGDVFYLRVLNRVLVYQVYETETVKPDQVKGLAVQEGRDLVTLVTCTPYGVNSHRLFIHGKRIPYEEDREISVSQIQRETLGRWLLRQKVFLASVVVLVAAFLAGLFILIRRMSRRHREKKEENS